MNVMTMDFFNELKQDYNNSKKDLVVFNGSLRGATIFLSAQVSVDELRQYKQMVLELNNKVEKFVDNFDNYVLDELENALHAIKERDGIIEAMKNERSKRTRRRDDNSDYESDFDDGASCISVASSTRSIKVSRRARANREISKYNIIATQLKKASKENRFTLKQFAEHVLKFDYTKLINALGNPPKDNYKGTYLHIWTDIEKWLEDQENINRLHTTVKNTRKT